jgi:Endonuclease/Exonuclease/phosphatase family
MRRQLRVVDHASFVVHLRYPTRDIYQLIFEVVETGDRFVVIASHWPSRRQGKEHSEPARIAVAENIAFLVRDQVRLPSDEYLKARAAGDLAAVQARFDTPILIMGDFNDEPCDGGACRRYDRSFAPVVPSLRQARLGGSRLRGGGHRGGLEWR